jgi:hypothetical protein
MPRPRFRSRVLLLATLLAPLLPIACSSASPEQQVLINFFRAARLRDNTTLANIAAVSFDPRRDGSVQQFTVASMGPEQRRTLQIRQLTDEAAKAKADDEDLAKRKQAYQAANLHDLERVVKARQDGKPIKGRDAELLAAWTKWSDDERQSQRHLSEVRSRLANERAAAVNSLTPPGQPDIDVSNMNVDIITKQVTVNAQVRTPEGQTVPRTLVFTLQRGVGTEGDRTVQGRWIITGLQQPRAASRT